MTHWVDANRGRLVVIALLAVTLGIGSLVLQRWVAETKTAAIVLVIGWFLVTALVALFLVRGREGMRGVVIGSVASIALATVAVGWWTGFRDRVVDEDVVVAEAAAEEPSQPADPEADKREKPEREKAPPEGPVELASGEFTGADGHAGRGTATSIELPDQSRVVTFTDFDVDPGARVEVWLTPSPGETEDRVELGALKGNVGDQQYDIPDGADLGKYDTVVIYCTPFTVRIAVAPLA